MSLKALFPAKEETPAELSEFLVEDVAAARGEMTRRAKLKMHRRFGTKAGASVCLGMPFSRSSSPSAR
jgi:hypothetical protein